MNTTETNPRRRSRERLGADAARVWARELELGNPYAKAILLAIANYMNEDGAAWPGLATISRDTDISEETVAKRLRWLESIGAIALFKCWRDENGRRNHDGNGKPTSSEIRFLFDADRVEIETLAKASIEPRPLRGAAFKSHEAKVVSPRPDGELTEEFSPRPDGEQNDDQDSTSTLVAPDQPPPASDVHIDSELQPEQQVPTPNPLPAEGGVYSETPSEKKEPDRLNIFAEAYPIPITDYAKAATMWAGLSEAERTEAITGAKGYAAFVKANPKRAAQDAHRWLRDRKWLGYLSAGRQAESLDARCDVFEGSEQWRAWEVFYCCCYSAMPSFLITGPQGEQKFNAPREWPPVGRGFNPDKSTWKTFHEGSGQFSAWLRRLHEIPNIAIGTPSVHVGGKYVRSITVPCEWPPRKDGTGPPSELSDEDVNEFLKSA